MASRTIVLDVKGTETLRQALADLTPRVERAAARALNQEHEAIMTEAKRRTPVDTGALRASGQVLPPEIRGTAIVSEGGFGNAAVKYSVYVHENLTARHPVGQAKFYESAILEAAAGMEERLAAEIRREIRP